MNDPRIIDVSGQSLATELDFWEPTCFTSEQIDDAVDRLASAPPPANGRREALLVHPRSVGSGPGLAPGIQVKLCVLLPGERTATVRHTSTQVNFCIRGGGRMEMGDQVIDFDRYDVWNLPSYRRYVHINDRSDVQVRLSYSNAALLEKLNVHLVEEGDAAPVIETPDGGEVVVRGEPGENLVISDDGASLMPYERLINPPAVVSRALHWPWSRVSDELDKLAVLGSEYVGRRLYLLYNPATGRTNGTTPNFFSAITIRPPGIVDRPHRHMSAAINYFFRGSGSSVINRKKYEWKAGDLMLTAPGWAVHHHASGPDEFVYEMTIQDQPFHIGQESLLWQENLRHPAIILGQEEGFSTNRTEVAG